jgi:hypothetical protein
MTTARHHVSVYPDRRYSLLHLGHGSVGCYLTKSIERAIDDGRVPEGAWYVTGLDSGGTPVLGDREVMVGDQGTGGEASDG